MLRLFFFPQPISGRKNDNKQTVVLSKNSRSGLLEKLEPAASLLDSVVVFRVPLCPWSFFLFGRLTPEK